MHGFLTTEKHARQCDRKGLADGGPVFRHATGRCMQLKNGVGAMGVVEAWRTAKCLLEELS